jgi:GNAT-family acetyltransferase (TIGR03103 family)
VTDPRCPGLDDLNPYSRIIADAALARGIGVEIVDPDIGELRLCHAGRAVTTIESLSELTSAVAFRRCDYKPATRHVLQRAGLRVAAGRLASFDAADTAFLEEVGEVVVKPARGEQGWGITVGVTDRAGLTDAVERARDVHPEVLLEQRVPGFDLRVLVIGDEVVAASLRRPASVTGDGLSSVAELIAELSHQREQATDGASTVPLDDITREVVSSAGYAFSDILDAGQRLAIRHTANLHTGATMEDVTDELHPVLHDVALAVACAIGIPVVGVDLMVPDIAGPDHVVIEANEQPGLANHEPRPTAARFIDLLFPGTG